MNQKRKAELQRKLSMTSVPRPPEGLLERIKADIPHDLKIADRERERFSRSTAFTMRVAASIILLISSVYVTVRLMSRADERALLPPVMARKAAPTAEVTIDLAEAPKRAIPPPAAAAPRAAVAAPVPQQVAQNTALDERKKESGNEIDEQKDQEAGVSAGVSGGALGTVAETRPYAPVPPAVAAAAEPPAESQRQAQEAAAKLSDRPENVGVTASAPAAMAKTARADNVAPAPPHAVFGLSIDPSAFERVRMLIEQGQRPTPGTVDVAGVVSYLAGRVRSHNAVNLEVEGSRAPTTPGKVLIRFTVETAHADVRPGTSAPEVGSDANLSITLNSDAVISHRLIGAETLKAQSTLVKNLSVTGVVDVELDPAVRPTTRIATLRLRYRATDGQLHTIDRIVRAAQVMRSWDSASHRHRLATLGAIWSESINGGAATAEMARRAERLATEAPADARARELATAASAFFRLQNSGPTGSGR
ncbi:MAG TPA: hypothetical protein VLV78_21010 [Thermoanaerobaculia bacterium]|nr:hypothetical protein [Thermoanaerobaculia bacterium]